MLSVDGGRWHGAYVLVDIIISSLNSGLSVSIMCDGHRKHDLYTLYMHLFTAYLQQPKHLPLIDIPPSHPTLYYEPSYVRVKTHVPSIDQSVRHTYHRSISQSVTSTAPPGCFPSSCAESSPSPSRSPLGSLSSSSLSEPVAQPLCIPP